MIFLYFKLEKAAEEQDKMKAAAKAARKKVKDKCVTIKACSESDATPTKPRPPMESSVPEKQTLSRKDSEVSNVSSVSEYSEGSETDTPITIKAAFTPMALKRHSDSFLDHRRTLSSTPKSDDDLPPPDLLRSVSLGGPPSMAGSGAELHCPIPRLGQQRISPLVEDSVRTSTSSSSPSTTITTSVASAHAVPKFSISTEDETSGLEQTKGEASSMRGLCLLQVSQFSWLFCVFAELSPVDEKDKESKGRDSLDSTPSAASLTPASTPIIPSPPQLLEPLTDQVVIKGRPPGINKPVHKSASASQLTLLIPPHGECPLLLGCFTVARWLLMRKNSHFSAHSIGIRCMYDKFFLGVQIILTHDLISQHEMKLHTVSKLHDSFYKSISQL